MAMASKIRILLIERNMKIKDLAQMLGYSGNNLSNKLRDDNFSEKELRTLNLLNNHFIQQNKRKNEVDLVL